MPCFNHGKSEIIVSSYPSFPIGINAHWSQSSEHQVLRDDNKLSHWLLDTRSLTEKLEAKCQTLSVHVIGQQITNISTNEKAALLTDEAAVCVREVILLGDNVPWVFARSLIPSSFLQNSESGLSNIGTKPLGKLIFNDKRFVRGEFEVAKIEHPLQPNDASQLVWARRSCFTYQHTNLSVAEVFLPDAPSYWD